MGGRTCAEKSLLTSCKNVLLLGLLFLLEVLLGLNVGLHWMMVMLVATNKSGWIWSERKQSGVTFPSAWLGQVGWEPRAWCKNLILTCLFGWNLQNQSILHYSICTCTQYTRIMFGYMHKNWHSVMDTVTLAQLVPLCIQQQEKTINLAPDW